MPLCTNRRLPQFMTHDDGILPDVEGNCSQVVGRQFFPRLHAQLPVVVVIQPKVNVELNAIGTMSEVDEVFRRPRIVVPHGKGGLDAVLEAVVVDSRKGRPL